MKHGKRVLVLGSTGYVGGRLVPLLLEKGFRVRAAGRSVDKIMARPWGSHPALEPVQADMFDPSSLMRAVQGCDTAFYLVHSMTKRHGDFSDMDRKAAYNMVEAANEMGLRRIIYLSGLGEDQEGKPLSKHLQSRAEVGRILALGQAECTTLRAAMVLGSGSASFEILRYLCDRLPVMLTPRWVNTLCQPISIRNVLGYLEGCLENEDTAGQTLDIGGPDVLTYAELFSLYAEEAGVRKPKLIAVPFVSPRLSSYWVNLITPVPVGLVRPLVDGLRNEVVCRDERIREMVPQELVSCRVAIRRALQKTEHMAVDSNCFDVGDACIPEWAARHDAPYAGGTVKKICFAARFQGDVSHVWKTVERIGGEHGWYYGDPLWRLRGWLDRLMAGPGTSRGRRDPEKTRVGDALDFWRVVDVDENRRLLLRAEMRLPGEAVLEFRLTPEWENMVELRMEASFMPRGLFGLAYWYGLYPLHMVLFTNMIENIVSAAGVFLYEHPKRVPPL
ncbi:SDR family oxidoreductase [Pseudodesulfovibrio senegalensis]|uniref:SDR family oxidoreductase n=1 Tax=Pseudodesulfovibrio senegalensis TaxID=1721087 RepID=A0A6N6N663_9BACT|nr:SDR family oxidoreductase [Pseudodesulfovibrio senegalensis]KAB1442975.1 SDR family oxidoreductase [Pseudodesulfovibrio senegalensis]